jgi:hypothetical protein
MVQAFETGDELGKGADLAHVVHEPLAKLLHKGFLRTTLHWASLQKNMVSNIKNCLLSINV